MLISEMVDTHISNFEPWLWVLASNDQFMNSSLLNLFLIWLIFDGPQLSWLFPVNSDKAVFLWTMKRALAKGLILIFVKRTNAKEYEWGPIVFFGFGATIYKWFKYNTFCWRPEAMMMLSTRISLLCVTPSSSTWLESVPSTFFSHVFWLLMFTFFCVILYSWMKVHGSMLISLVCQPCLLEKYDTSVHAVVVLWDYIEQGVYYWTGRVILFVYPSSALRFLALLIMAASLSAHRVKLLEDRTTLHMY